LQSSVGAPCDVSDRLRAVAGAFPTGVTVLTAIADGRPVGMAANSFTSLSLTPPLVLVCIGRSSTTWPAIESAGRFCVNILAEDQESLARSFAAKGTNRFIDVAHTLTDAGAPLLYGAAAFIDCTIDRIHDGGDHLVVIAAVCDLGVLRDDAPLVFHRSKFGLRHSLDLSDAPRLGPNSAVSVGRAP
jgi:3-hydroxy-9,10-secoandrosta-1,3,5(10)-triene-9,17-dione monooxygenase reductase component